MSLSVPSSIQSQHGAYDAGLHSSATRPIKDGWTYSHIVGVPGVPRMPEYPHPRHHHHRSVFRGPRGASLHRTAQNKVPVIIILKTFGKGKLLSAAAAAVCLLPLGRHVARRDCCHPYEKYSYNVLLPPVSVYPIALLPLPNIYILTYVLTWYNNTRISRALRTSDRMTDSSSSTTTTYIQALLLGGILDIYGHTAYCVACCVITLLWSSSCMSYPPVVSFFCRPAGIS